LYLADACWALSYLTDGSNERIQLVVDSGAVPILVQKLSTAVELNVITPCVRALGNVATGSDEQTESVIAAGALPLFGSLLGHSKMNLVKEAAWTLSNITAGNTTQIQKVIDNGLLPPPTQVLIDGDFKSQKEAAWALTNLTSGGTVEQIIALCQQGAIKPMCNMLGTKDDKTVLVMLDGIFNILSAAQKLGEEDKVALMIEDCDGLDKIESMQQHENETIYQKALHIVQNFFPEDDTEDENAVNVFNEEVS